MPLRSLDHVNLRTNRLSEMCRFYTEVLGLSVGDRPPFKFNGAWLYCSDRPVVHLVEVKPTPEHEGQLTLEHFAFAAEGLTDFVARLERHRVEYTITILPGFGTRQVNFFDPDGNHVHAVWRDFNGDWGRDLLREHLKTSH